MMDTQEAIEQGEVSGMVDNFSRYTAISDPASGAPVELSEVIAKLSEREKLEAGESICYIGSGKFAVVRGADEGKGAFAIERIINYESDGNRAPWRTELRFKPSLSYTPQPQSLQKMYTSDEIRAMPKFT